MSNYKCGKCGKEYTFDEWLTLQKIQIVPEDTNPKKQHGFTAVCQCGYVFHRDKWHLKNNFEIQTEKGPIKGEISTVFLELNHGFGGKDLWYETMVFPEGDVECYFQDRYTTQEEAKIGHTKVLKALISKNYKLEPHEWLLTINVE